MDHFGVSATDPLTYGRFGFEHHDLAPALSQCARRGQANYAGTNDDAINIHHLQTQLGAMEGFGEAAWGSAFDAAKAGQSVKSVGSKPAALTLRRETSHQDFRFALDISRLQWHENIGMSKIALVLGDLVFQYRVITPRIPGQLGQQCMVLVPIGAMVRENKVRLNRLLQSFKCVLYGFELRREITGAKIEQFQSWRCPTGVQLSGSSTGFRAAQLVRREDRPHKLCLWPLASPTQQGATAADFNIVAVGAYAQQRSDGLEL
jgi:hypothetical protein